MSSQADVSKNTWAILLVFAISTACSTNGNQPLGRLSTPSAPSEYAVALQQYRDKKFQEAITTLDSAVGKGLPTSEIHNLRGLINQQLNKQDLAIGDFTRAIELDPANAEGYNNRALSYQVKGDNANAEADLTKSIQVNPTFATAHYNLGILMYTQRRYTDAAKSLVQATTLNPDDSDTWFQLGLTYDRLHDAVRALAAFNRVIQIEQGFDDQVFFLRGLVFYEQGKWDQAYKDFDEAIHKGLKNRNTLFYRGVARYRLGQLEGALEDLGEAIKYDPRFSEAYYYRSYVYARQGNQTKAREDAQKAIELDPPREGAE